MGPTETFKIVYNLPPAQQSGGKKGVALVEAVNKQWAIHAFQQDYAGQYSTIDRVEKLIK